MALKAGYKGVKKSVLDSLLSLLGSLAIKDVGDGLTLDSDGELSVDVGDGLTFDSGGELLADIDTDTMEFKDGKLAAKITSGYSKDVLYTSDTYTDTIGLTFPEGKDLDDYDQIMIIYGGFSDKPALVFTINVDDLKVYAAYTAGTFALTNPHLFLLVYVNDALRITLNSDNTGLIVQQRSGTTSCVRKVIGVKF